MSPPDHPAERRGKRAAAGNADHDAAEAERVWSHGLHEDNMFIQRGNFFLVAQSMLVVAYSGILAAGPRLGQYGLAVPRVIAGFGLAMSALWILTSYLHLSYLRHLRDLAVDSIPEFGTFRTSWQRGGRPWLRKIDIAVLIAYGVPLLASVLWVILLILV